MTIVRKAYWIIVLAMMVGVGAMLAGCQGEKEGPAGPAVDVYKVGAIFSVTGKASFLGDPEKKTVDMIVEEINANGGINGIPLEVIVEDDAGSEDKTKLAATKRFWP